MAFELRADGRTVCTCDTAEEALSRVRDLVRTTPDCEPEIFDLATGRPLEPAASRHWRDDLARKMGY